VENDQLEQESNNLRIRTPIGGRELM